MARASRCVELGARRQVEALAGQPLARAGQPRGHRRGGHQEQPRDVLGGARPSPAAATAPPRTPARAPGARTGAPAAGARRTPSPCRLPGVGHHALGLLGELGLDGEHGQLAGGDRLGAEPVEDAVAGGGQQPGGGVGGRAVGRPGTGGGLEGVAEAVLGQVEAAVPGDEQGQQPAPLVAPDVLDRGHPT